MTGLLVRDEPLWNSSESRVTPQIDFFLHLSTVILFVSPHPITGTSPCQRPKHHEWRVLASKSEKRPFCLDYRVSRVSAAANRGKMAAPNSIICPIGPQ
ncbi:hypothetical protein TNCT_107611 [Trichonephila clavata]|uniref:Uncharacterized protein n=1 Tax=Trichonephila clavata TaxID=2740835 RepID=A0A8X6H0F0_TRICU|nr:hypothetical protein TNCT_107611 [Trichonephila clavata]